MQKKKKEKLKCKRENVPFFSKNLILKNVLKQLTKILIFIFFQPSWKEKKKRRKILRWRNKKKL